MLSTLYGIVCWSSCSSVTMWLLITRRLCYLCLAYLFLHFRWFVCIPGVVREDMRSWLTNTKCSMHRMVHQGLLHNWSFTSSIWGCSKQQVIKHLHTRGFLLLLLIAVVTGSCRGLDFSQEWLDGSQSEGLLRKNKTKNCSDISVAQGSYEWLGM